MGLEPPPSASTSPGRGPRDSIEVGNLPSMLRYAGFVRSPVDPDRRYAGDDASVPNAAVAPAKPADEIRNRRAVGPMHTVNLPLLPIPRADLALFGAPLDVNPVTFPFRGYDNCRISDSAMRNASWRKSFNSGDVSIPSTLEVIDLPPVARPRRRIY